MKYYDHTEYSDFSGKKSPRGGGGWKTVWKIFAWTVCVLFLLFIGVIIGFKLYFTPERIAELISKEASERIDGKLNIKGLNYSLFSKLPEVYIEIDSLEIISAGLDKVSPEIISELPSDASQLVSAAGITAGINIYKLINRDISISEISIESLRANIVDVNDSVNNYDIFPPPPQHMEMPEISIGKILFGSAVDVNYFNLQDSVSVMCELDRFMLEAVEKGGYAVDLGLKISGKTPYIDFDKKLSIGVTGEMDVNPKPLTADLRNFTIKAEPFSLKLNGVIKQDDKIFKADSLDLQLSFNNLLDLRNYVPESLPPLPAALELLEGELPLVVDCKLLETFNIPTALPDTFSLKELPAFLVNVSLPHGNILYHATPSEKLKIDDIVLDTSVTYNPTASDSCFVFLKELGFYSEGVHVLAEAFVTDVLGSSPEVSGRIDCKTRLENSVSPLLASSGLTLKGEIEARSDFSCTLSDLADVPASFIIKDIDVKGDLFSSMISASAKKQPLNVNLANPDFKFTCSVPEIDINNFNSNNLLSAAFLSFDFKGAKIDCNSSDGKLTASGVDLSFFLDSDTLPKTSQVGGQLDLSLQALQFSGGGNLLDLAGVKMDLNGSLLKTPKYFSANCNTSPANDDEKILLQRISYTPLYLVPSCPAVLNAAVSMADLDITLGVDAGKFATPLYLHPVLFSDVSLKTDLDRIEIGKMSATIGDTSFTLEGDVEGLAAFMTSGSASDLDFSMDVSFTNVDINSLAGGYYGAVEKNTGKPYDFTPPPIVPYTAADSVCVVIPRNLNGTVRLNAGAAEYMGYRFSPLSTDIILKGGVATLSQLKIGAPYTGVTVDWTYSTSALNDIFMAISADVDKFDFAKFFRIFPQLTDAAPEIKNLGGEISAVFSGKFGMFPSMFLEPLSMQAKFAVKGSGLNFARAGKIEHITHLMRIEGDAPIKITGLDITGSFHDNLLLIDPFHIDFDDYRIGIAGVNNLAGNMYYHLALEKSPFHIPFAVNLVGNFKHPEVRFGGVGVKDGREREISADLTENVDVNIMDYLHRGWIMFVEEAAKYYLRK